MRDHADAFTPTVPGDEDDFGPAPATPSERAEGLELEYEGEPNYRGSNDREPREGSPEFDHSDQVESNDDQLEKPAANASRDDWVAYALSLGHTEEQLADYKRDDLVQMFS